MKRSPVPLEHRLALSVEEAGALLGIGRSKAYQLVKAKVLPTVVIGGRTLVPRRALEAMLERGV